MTFITLPFPAVVRKISRLSILKSRPRTAGAWIVLNILFCIALWAALGYRAETLGAEVRASLKTSAVTLAGSYSEQVARAISTIDEHTLTLKHYWERDKSDVDLKQQWSAGLFGFERLNGVAIFNKRGALVMSSYSTDKVAYMGDKPYFTDYKTNRMQGLHIMPPSVGLLSNRTIIRFTRELRDALGEFDGVLSIACLPQFFASTFGQSRLGPHDFLSIRDAAGTIYVRQTRESASFGPSLFSAEQIMNRRGGFAQMPATVFSDRVARYVAWAPVEGTPLIAVAALSVDDALFDYNASRTAHYRLGVLWTIFLVVMCLAGLVLYGRFLAHGNDADRARRTFRLAAESAGEGFYMLEPIRRQDRTVCDFRIVDCNETGARYFEFNAETLTGKTICELDSGTYGQKLIGAFRTALEKGFEEEDVRVPVSSRFNAEWIHRKMVATDGCLAVTVHNITEKKAQEKSLREVANTDSLTRLPNRYWLLNQLPQILEKAGHNRAEVAQFFIDLDNFKDINDTLGHHAGDVALRTTAQRLLAAVRTQDAVVRLGGDEFTVIVENVGGSAGATPLAERIVEELRKPFVVEGSLVPLLRASVGISLFPRDGLDGTTLLRNADTAMYAAKTKGKGCYAFFSPEIGRLRSERLDTERELREAIERNEFVMHYQPRVRARDGRVVGAEALVRWRHPVRGLVQPADFIPLAEETGLILELGQIVIDAVCSQIAEWALLERILVPISINVSPQQFNRQDVAGSLTAAIRQCGISPDLIEVELTESAMIDSKAMGKQFSDLTALGIRLLVDDFGTGYSSLAQMQLMHLDVLKVDHSLTAELEHGPQARLFYQAIVAMAHALKMSITAEGVETPEQLRILTELDCDEIQGYVIARPLPALDFQAFLRAAVGGPLHDSSVFA